MGRKALSVLLIFVVVSLVIYLSDDEDSLERVKVSTKGSLLRDTILIQKRDGELRFELKAKETIISEDGRLIEMKDVQLNFHERDLRVTAKEAHYFQDSGDLNFSGGIVGTSKELTLTATDAHWRAHERTLYSDRAITIEGKGFFIVGNSGKAKGDSIELNRGVKAIVFIKNQRHYNGPSPHSLY